MTGASLYSIVQLVWTIVAKGRIGQWGANSTIIGPSGQERRHVCPRQAGLLPRPLAPAAAGAGAGREGGAPADAGQDGQVYAPLQPQLHQGELGGRRNGGQVSEKCQRERGVKSRKN